MSRIGTRFLFAATALLLAGVAQASVSFEVDVNTSGLMGTTGYLDFQFDPGNTPYDAGSATITALGFDGTLGAALPDVGDVTGSLPGSLVINNTDATNEYTQAYTFGSYFDFLVTLNIPTVSGTAAGGNSFTFDVEDSGFNPLLSSSFPAVEIDLDALTAAPTVTNNTSDVNPNGFANVAPVPEPAAFALLGTGLAFLAWRRGRAVRN